MITIDISNIEAIRHAYINISVHVHVYIHVYTCTCNILIGVHTRCKCIIDRMIKVLQLYDQLVCPLYIAVASLPKFVITHTPW